MRWNPEYAIAQNLKEFRPEQVLFNQRLADVGYNNRFVGKWHCGRDRMPEDYGNVYNSHYKQYLRARGLQQPSAE